MQKANSLIRTKLRPPFTRAELVGRPRLQQQLAQGLRGPLTLVTAPAGFGKTTLVVSTLASAGMPVAWLSLDKNDNEVARFLNYLIAALQEVEPTIGLEATVLLSATQRSPTQAALTSLVNDLVNVGSDWVLVLDDYQFLRSQNVHRALSFLLEHCPQTLHLVIATRSDPPLPLARLRARGQTVELRAADLSFTRAEAAQFLNDVMGLSLDKVAVAALAERTEGWAAGLQMAALSMRHQQDVRGFIEGFSGTNRYIMDYLLEEVLASQPPAIKRFLLCTSILERLTAPLCDALLASGSIAAGDGEDLETARQLPPDRSSAKILAHLEQANLFLVPLDDERIWYRYHHLFADLLQAQLQKSLAAQELAQLHVRAAEWYGHDGSLLEAIHHAAMAADEERVERYVEQSYLQLVSRGEQSGLRSWTGTLSKGLVHRRPWLRVYEAMSHSWFGELDEADRLLAEADKHTETGIATADARALQGQIAYVRSRVTAMRGDNVRAIAFGLVARQHVPRSNLALQLDTRITLGYVYFLHGDYDNAHLVLNDTVKSGKAAGAVINTVAAACVLARLYAIQGQLRQSHDAYQMAARAIPQESGQHRGARALIELGLADVLYERNDLAGALARLNRSLDLLPSWDKADDWILAYVTLARLHMARGNTGAAIEAVESAKQFIETRGVFSEARAAAEYAQVRLWLARGDLQAAGNWAKFWEAQAGADDGSRFENEPLDIMHARVLLRQGQCSKAVELLSRLEEAARSAARMGRVLEIAVLKALAFQESGDSERTMLALTDCLALAQPQGYARIFLDEGRSMQLLLAQWLAHASRGPLHDYAVRLLAHFDAQAQGEIEPMGHSTRESDLVEALSPRELEVLHLMALGRTNRQIAEQLVVALGTVKAHTANIYRKLDVGNRTEAVTRARQAGILP